MGEIMDHPGNSSRSGGPTPWARAAAGRTRPGEVLLAVVAAVSWAFLAMAGVAAPGQHLVGAEGAGALGPMTAAAVVLAVGGSVSPVRGCGAFGLQGAQARSAIDIAPLGIGLVGALLLGGVFARSLRQVGAVIGGAEPAARAGAVVLLFLLVLAGLTWVGNDTVTIDAATLDLKGKPEQEGLFGELPGEPGDIADIGSGLLPDRIERLIDDQGGGRVHRRGGALCAGRQWSGASRCCSSRCSSRCWWRAARRCRAALRRHTVPSDRPPPRCTGYWCSRSGRVSRRRSTRRSATTTPAWSSGRAARRAERDVARGAAGAVRALARRGERGAGAGGARSARKLPADEKGQPITVARIEELDGRVWLPAVARVPMILTARVLTAVRVRPSAGPVGRASRDGVRCGWGSSRRSRCRCRSG